MFCERIGHLAIGGPWGGNLKFLATCLQYVVACRINDRRAIPFIDTTGGGEFMRLMEDNLRKSRNPTISIPRIHQLVRHTVRAKGFDLPWYSLIFQSLEKLAYDPATEPYQITTEDLHLVERAVSSCKDLGQPIFRFIGDVTCIVSHGRNFDFPKTYDHIRTLQIALYKHHKRLLEKKGMIDSLSSADDGGMNSSMAGEDRNSVDSDEVPESLSGGDEGASVSVGMGEHNRSVSLGA